MPEFYTLIASDGYTIKVTAVSLESQYPGVDTRAILSDLSDELDANPAHRGSDQQTLDELRRRLSAAARSVNGIAA